MLRSWRHLRRLAGLTLVAAFAASAHAAPSLVNHVVTQSAPRRVASLNLSSDEVLAEILPPDRLVSVTRWVDEPGTSNILGRIPASVYRFRKVDMERLVALSPDLVVVSEYTDADFLDLIARSGMRYHRMRGLDSLSGIRAAILDLGRAVDEEQAAQRLVARYDATLGDLEHRIAGAKKPRVLYWTSGMTAGEGTAIGALIEGAGGINVGRELGVQGIAPPGVERAFVADPDLILVGAWPRAVEGLKEQPLLSNLRAVRENHIIVMPNELLVALSQYAADACWYLASRLHPDRVPKARP